MVVGLRWDGLRTVRPGLSEWWNSWANGWSPQIAQPGFSFVGGLALALLLWEVHGRAGLRSDRLDECDVYWQRSARTREKISPRALLFGCGIVVVLYVLANVAYLAVLPFPEIQHAPQNRVAVAMMNAVFGHPGAMCMAAAIMISTFGCNNGLILAGARVYYAMARDGLFFKKIATTNARHVPAAALVAQGIWTAFLTLPRTMTTDSAGKIAYGNVYTQLLEYIVSADLIFYLLLVGAVIVLRSKSPPGRAAVSDLGLSDRPAHLDLARWIVDCRSCLARAGHVGNRNRNRAYRFAGLSFLAQKRCELKQIRFRFHERNICMPARSKKQQMAAGAALAAKRGKRSKSSLKGASRQMARSMSEKQLREFAKTKRKKLPTKSARGADGRRIFQLLAAIPARDYRSLWLPPCDKRRDSL